MRRAAFLLLATALAAPATVFYTKAAGRLMPGTPPPMAAPEDLADRLLVEKSERRLSLYREGRLLARYRVALGGDPGGGPKRQDGDERTPEGLYRIDWRNDRSIAHLSLHISYPEAGDLAQAAAAGVSPGGNIMIHGLPNGWGFLGGLHRAFDWTDGCIAVTNAEMRDIWARVPTGTEIEIRP